MSVFCFFPEYETREESGSVLAQINVYQDALEFPDGEAALLTRQCENQHATVLQLAASSPCAPAAGKRSGHGG
jgi:hypothetical protein